jgi:hypothetical protein
MPFLNEYIKLRTEINRELNWQELDDNFLYVANEWNPYRKYKQGHIIYYDAGTEGKSWFRATEDNGPSTSFDLGSWEAIGASNAGSGSIIVESNPSSYVVNVIEFDSSKFIVTNPGSTAYVTLNASAVNQYWLEAGDSNIGNSENDSAIIHTGEIVVGSGSFPSSYKMAVYGSTYISGDLTLGGTINSVDISALASAYVSHSHTILPTNYTSYSSLYPTSVSALADFNINKNTLANGHTITWNSSLNRWVNTAPSTSSFSSLSDVQFSTLLNNQILRYNTSNLKWQNISITADNNNGISTAPFSHRHDATYYTKTQLNSSGSGGQVHWNNITSKPADTREYLLASTSGSSPFTQNNYRVLTSGDGSITIITTTPNVIDIRTPVLSLELQDVYDNGNTIDGIELTLESTTSGFIISLIDSASTPGGNNLIALGKNSAHSNSGDNVISLGYQAAYDNSGSHVNAFGQEAASYNTGGHVIAGGQESAKGNTGNNVNALGQEAASGSSTGNTGDDVNALGYRSAFGNSGNDINALGKNSALDNTGNHVIALGENSANNNSADYVVSFGDVQGNTLQGQFIINNSFLPSYSDYNDAYDNIAITGIGIPGCTYLFYNQATQSIGAVRL